MDSYAKVHRNTTFKRFLCQSCSTSILEHTGPGGASTELSASSPPTHELSENQLITTSGQGAFDDKLIRRCLNDQRTPSNILTVIELYESKRHTASRDPTSSSPAHPA